MSTKLIRLQDGILVEVEVLPGEPTKISSNSAEDVSTTVDKITPILVKTCRPIAAAWKDISEEVQIEQAEIQLGFSFEAEGNVFVTKAKAGANLVVKLILKKKQ